MRANEYEANRTNKRGKVVERAPGRHQIRVQFEDEDDVVSHWIDVLGRSGGETKSFMMPDLGDEVWCGMDSKGEDGCLLGVKYNDTSAPPFSSNDDIGLTWDGGSVHINKASGSVTVETGGPVTINTSGTVKIVATGIELESDTLTHNGVDISDKHEHRDVQPGTARTGPPA